MLIFKVDKHNDSYYFELMLSLLCLANLPRCMAIFFSCIIKIIKLFCILPIKNNQPAEICELRTARGEAKG
jgi:hypothetical protein